MKKILLLIILLFFGIPYCKAQYQQKVLYRFKVKFPPVICFFPETFPYLHDSLSNDYPVVFIDTTAIVPVESTYAGYRIFISNATEQEMIFRTASNCLLLYAEAKQDTSWIPVTALMGEGCISGGPTLLKLPSHSTFEVAAPLFEGALIVDLRYVLVWQYKKYYSNTIKTTIDPAMLDLKNMPTGLQDARVDPGWYVH